MEWHFVNLNNEMNSVYKYERRRMLYTHCGTLNKMKNIVSAFIRFEFEHIEKSNVATNVGLFKSFNGWFEYRMFVAHIVVYTLDTLLWH